MMFMEGGGSEPGAARNRPPASPASVMTSVSLRLSTTKNTFAQTHAARMHMEATTASGVDTPRGTGSPTPKPGIACMTAGSGTGWSVPSCHARP